MKDPAFNFYSDNFLSGTMFMTDEQVGKYIRLLCAQHQHGHLSEKHMIIICKSHDVDIWNKFIKDANGFYFNERLEIEINKRKKYSESRSNNKKGKIKEKIICESYDNHMGIGNTNINSTISDTNIIGNFENLSNIPIDKIEEYFISQETWVEDLARRHKLSKDYDSAIAKAKEWIHLFVEKLKADNVKEWDRNDCFRYCNNWTGVELEKIKKNGNKKSSGLSSEEEQREFLNAVASGIARAEHERNIAV